MRAVLGLVRSVVEEPAEVVRRLNSAASGMVNYYYLGAVLVSVLRGVGGSLAAAAAARRMLYLMEIRRGYLMLPGVEETAV